MTEKTKKKNIGYNICTLRRECGMTQAQLAEKIDVSASQIAHMESGDRSLSLQLLLNLCTVMKVTPNDILAEAYVQDDSGELQEEKSISLSDIGPEDGQLLKYIHHYLANKKKVQ